MENERISVIFNEVYNVFWMKYRNLKLTKDSTEWEDIVTDAKKLIERYNCLLAINMVNDLITELEQRCMNIHSS